MGHFITLRAHSMAAQTRVGKGAGKYVLRRLHGLSYDVRRGLAAQQDLLSAASYPQT